MLTAKNEKELLEILKSVCENATSKAVSSMQEVKDPAVEKYLSQYKEDEKMLGNLSEQEADESEDLAADADEDTDAPDTDAPDEASSEAPEEFGVSFDSIIAAINALRSGRSLRDSSVKQQALDYYDRLDDSERKVLLLFLNSFADILTGEVQGASAIDPSDPPHSVKMSAGDEEEEDTPAEKEASPSQREPEADQEDEEEDTSPPIKVNESQDLALLREKIKLLMA